MALSLTAVLIFALGMSSGYAQYSSAMSSYSVPVQSYNSPAKSASSSSYTSYQIPVVSYNAPASYKSDSYAPSPSYSSYQAPVQSYNSPAKSAPSASYTSYQIPVVSYNAPATYKSDSYAPSPSYSSYQAPVQSYNSPAKSTPSTSYTSYQIPVQSYNAPASYKSNSSAYTSSYTTPYQTPVASYNAPAKSSYPTSSYQVPVQSYSAPSTYKSTSSYQAPAASPSYGASYKNSSSYGNSGYSDVRNVRVAAVASIFTENTPGTSQSFLTELLSAIQSVSNLRFKVTIREDLTYPKQQPDGSWDGSILAPLLNNEVDLVGPDLTPNTEGEKVVEFTQPILPYKLQVLVKAGTGYSGGYSSQNNLQYVIADTKDLTYLKNSPQPALQAIANNILQGQANGLETVVNTDDQGVAKVLSGYNYAYIIESPFVQSYLSQNSNLQVLPGDLGGYFNLAFATQLGSTLRKPFNIALLQVLQDGILKSLLQKYNVYNTAL